MKIKMHFSFRTQLILLVSGLVFIQFVFLVGLFHHLTESALRAQLGRTVLDVSTTISSSPRLVQLLEQQDPSMEIQAYAESIRAKTNASYIVIGDKDGIRYSHPDRGKIGKPMTGGDNQRALNLGQSYLSTAVGSLGESTRGKSAIFNSEGEIIGVVSVGYLENFLDQKIDNFQNKAIVIMAPILLIGIFMALLIANRVKKSIFGLEPQEIGVLYSEKQIILETVREAIIAIDELGRITLINSNAATVLGVGKAQTLIGKPLADISEKPSMLRVLKSGVAELDEEHVLNGEEIIVNRLPILDHNGATRGVVSSFRLKNEIDRVTSELSRVKEYSDLLRQQTHEYSNKLHTISGLIQLKEYDKAIALIDSETESHQEIIRFLLTSIQSPEVSGLLLGKYNLSKHLNIDFEIDRDSSFEYKDSESSSKNVISILGNLIDNAFNAVKINSSDARKVKLSLSDIGREYIIEIEDNGPGLPKTVDALFEKGISSSEAPDRGYGLYIVKQHVEWMHGYIETGISPLGGARFTIFLPRG